MKKHLAWVAHAAVLISVACTSGTNDVIGPPAKVATVADAGADAEGLPDDAGSGDGSSPMDATVAAPQACGSFAVGTGGFYTSGMFQGSGWTGVNAASSISPSTFSSLPAGGPYCVTGTVVVPSQGYAWAILGLDLDALRTPIAMDGGTDAGADGGAPSSDYEAYSVVPISDGLLVDVTNTAKTPLELCLLGTNGTLQWCMHYTGQSFVPWTSFLDNYGNGTNQYARQPITAFDVTVPGPAAGQVSFDFCLNSVVEAASWCGCAGGACSCASGSTDCSGSCTDTTTDPSNCGSCGQACSAISACGASQCHDTVAPGQSDPFSIALDGTYAYFANYSGGTVMKVPLAGGSATTIASGQSHPIAVAVYGGDVYWANDGTAAGGYMDGSIMAAAMDGGAPVMLARQQTSPARLATDGANVYWTNEGTSAINYTDGAVMKLALSAGATPVVLAANQAGPLGIATDGANVYWVTAGTAANGNADGTVMKVASSGGGMPIQLASGQASPMSIAVDAMNAYFTNTLDDTVNSVPLAGPAPAPVSTLASAQGKPFGIAVDATNVYWTNEISGSVMKKSLSGGSPVTLARGQNRPYGIAVQAGTVYFTTQNRAGEGGILHIP